MARPITGKVRAAERRLHAQGKARNKIAREMRHLAAPLVRHGVADR